MVINSRFHILLSFTFALIVASPSQARAQDHSQASGSEAYRRQVKFEIERANDFHRFQRHLAEIEAKRQSGIPAYKADAAKEQAQYEKARVAYSEWKKREEAKKPSEEFIERMLAEAAKRDEEKREAERRKYRAVQAEIKRAIANSRLDENEEYGLEEFNFAE